MFELAAAGGGLIAAGGCCLATSRVRARVLAVAMAVAMVLHAVPAPPPAWTLAAPLIALAVIAAAGERRRPDVERIAGLHRAVGGVVMAAAMMLHAPGAGASAGHGHGGPAATAVDLAALVYLVWSAALLWRPHRRGVGLLEPAAMALMTAAMLADRVGAGG